MGVWEGRGPNVRPSAHSGWATLEGGIGSPRATVSEVEPGLRGGQIAPFLMRCGALVLGYLPHSGVEGHFLGGFQAVDTGAGPESRGRSLRTPTCRRGHRQYLSSGPLYDFPRYRSTVHEVTQVFAAASREVLALEAELAGPRAQPLLASHVRSLQQLEETRLTTVALLQLMGTPELTGQEDSLQMHQLKMKVIKTMEAISEVLQDLRFDAESAE